MTSTTEIEPPDILVEDVWIPMPDGIRLHGRIWRPEDAESPVPALLEYLPYRLDDWTSVRDSERHPYYAAHGYASVRVDIRGTGSSEGLFDDEYSPAELDDGIAVIEWLAAQPWCTGKVGMFGISWGGFNALQIAERAPEALGAVVTVCSTDDRYDNDVHYMGGAVLGIDMAAWAGTMLAFASRPPAPAVVGDGWVEQWRRRLEHQTPLAPVWLGHQERDEYWRRGSVCENYPGVKAAVLAVGGWSDPYRDTVFRLLEHLDAPARGIIGPWSHQYPDRGLAPGPAIGFLQETLRWWDRWLKDIHNGVEAEPDLRAWINGSEPPNTYVEQRTGRWIGVPWRARPQVRRLGLGNETVTVRTPWATGQDAGRFFPFGNRADLPPDQRAEDGRSVCVDLPVGEDGLEFLGRPVARLRVRSDSDRGHVIVRLCDVAPDGSSTLVTRGVLNLLKRDGMDRVDPLTPGEYVDVAVPLVSNGYRIAPGHRLRVAFSNHYWPWIWPHAVDDTLEVDLAASLLELPRVPADPAPVDFPTPERARPITVTRPSSADEQPARPERRIVFDVASAETVLQVDPGYGGTRRYPDGLDFLEDAVETYRIRENDPTSARADSRWRIELSCGTWSARVETSSSIAADQNDFVIDNQVLAVAVRNGQEEIVADRRFHDRVPRTSA